MTRVPAFTEVPQEAEPEARIQGPDVYVGGSPGKPQQEGRQSRCVTKAAATVAPGVSPTRDLGIQQGTCTSESSLPRAEGAGVFPHSLPRWIDRGPLLGSSSSLPLGLLGTEVGTVQSREGPGQRCTRWQRQVRLQARRRCGRGVSKVDEELGRHGDRARAPSLDQGTRGPAGPAGPGEGFQVKGRDIGNEPGRRAGAPQGRKRGDAALHRPRGNIKTVMSASHEEPSPPGTETERGREEGKKMMLGAYQGHVMGESRDHRGHQEEFQERE